MAVKPPLPQLPSGMVRSMEAYAREDADLVGIFLRDLCGLPTSPDHPVHLPADFLVDLAAALRLFVWQDTGIDPTRIADLPEPVTALRDVVRQVVPNGSGTRTDVPPGDLSARVLATYVERFAWLARLDLAVDVTLGPVDGESLLDALADFLWESRPR
jgi:hypothetical protein